MTRINHRPNVVLSLLACLALALLSGGTVTRAAPSLQRSAAAAPVIQITRQGGNIRPFSVTIDSAGALTTTGIPAHPSLTISKVAVRGLLKLVHAERFFALPLHIHGKLVNPDVATLSITVTTRTRTRTVTEWGARNARFDQLFAVVTAVAGASF